MPEKQTRRGFFKLLGGLASIGAAMGLAPALLAPIKDRIPKEIITLEWRLLDPTGLSLRGWDQVMTMTCDPNTGDVTLDGVEEFQKGMLHDHMVYGECKFEYREFPPKETA